jgi:hypothetical protein
MLFSISWLWLSFTFSLKLVKFGVDYQDIGIIGVSLSLPFIPVSYLYRKSRMKHINFALKFPFAFLFAVSTAFFILNIQLELYIILLASSGIAQSFWWISSEIETGFMPTGGSAEKYAAAWAIPSGVFPIFAGIVIQFLGFDPVYVIVMISSIVGFIIQPVDFKERKGKREGTLDYVKLVPMILMGIAIGYTSFVLTPLMKNSGFSYIEIGILIGIFGIAFSFGSIISHYSRKLSTDQFAWITSIFSASYLLLLLNFSFMSIALALLMAGMGGSMGFSKILSYIGESESPRNGVYYYETLFAIGFVTGSFGGDTLLSLFNYKYSLLLFLPSLAFSIFYFRRLALSGPKPAFSNVE